MKLALPFALLLATPALGADTNIAACNALFSGDQLLTEQCRKAAPTAKGQPIQTLNDRQLASFCSTFDASRSAATCFANIGWLRFFKGDGAGENLPGLRGRFADLWKDVAVQECFDSSSSQLAIDCAIRTRNATALAFDKANADAKRDIQDADPILRNCRAKWQQDYEMIEYCVKKQRAAKERLGID